MSWKPKVGDRVMVDEHGPYEVVLTRDAGQTICLAIPGAVGATWLPSHWLTPAPEPEPDEPTAPGALVRDGEGRLRVRLGGTARYPWSSLDLAVYESDRKWADLPRPITVVLADPAEVEQLRADLRALGVEYDRVIAERDEARAEVDTLREARNSAVADAEGITDDLYRARRERDELQWRIDDAYRRLSEGPAVKTYQEEVSWRQWIAACLSRRGES